MPVTKTCEQASSKDRDDAMRLPANNGSSPCIVQSRIAIVAAALSMARPRMRCSAIGTTCAVGVPVAVNRHTVGMYPAPSRAGLGDMTSCHQQVPEENPFRKRRSRSSMTQSPRSKFHLTRAR